MHDRTTLRRIHRPPIHWLAAVPFMATVALLLCAARPHRAAANWDDQTASFLALINAYRLQNGAGPLAVDATLQQAADWQSNDQLNTLNCTAQPDGSATACSHTDSLGRDDSTRIWDGFDYGGDAVAENIYWGNPAGSAQSAFDAWRASDGHNRTMLDGNFRAIGIGRLCRADGWCFWTTTFGDIVELPFVAPAGAPAAPPAVPAGSDPSQPQPAPRNPEATPTPAM